MYKTIKVGTAREPITVVGVTADAETLPKGLTLDKDTRETLATALETPGFKANAGETAIAGATGLLLGLGERDALDGNTLREAGALLVKQLDRMGAKSAHLSVSNAVPARKLSADDVGRALGEGLALGNWRVDFFDGKATNRDPARASLTVAVPDAKCKAGVRAGLAVAGCANEARRVAATPPNICNPEWIAKEARRLARGAGLSCRVITAQQAEKQGMGGLVNVGKGSDSKPRLVILEHEPPRARKGITLALVGKTMTYDTGGYSLKSGTGMRGMKYDGNGGCAVLGAMLAIATLKLPVRVVGLLPTAENMVSGDAYRPDDIITMYNGTSVEVTNTDAEGRLILGDALAYACKTVKPTAIIDVATLTGGIVVALGSWCAGLFCNDADLRRRVEAAGEKTGERVWPMPLWKEHREFMRARHADIWNSGPKRDGHPIQGAAFLSYFVDEKIPWAHLDIAGVSAVDNDGAVHVNGPTGFGVRLLTETVAGFCS